MADFHYVIGIGGVGSRIMESVVRLCESGYFVQDRITCLMIDADANCGNTLQTSKLLKDYSSCREKIGAGGKIFTTELVGVGDGKNKTFVATPIKETALTVEDDLVKLSSREAYNFMNATYSEEEYTMNVTEGFYGKPTVGSLVFARSIDSDNGAISKVINDISMNTASDENRVFVYLAASLFGGTGASGLPTIASAIKGKATKRENLHMMACLMLPYFKFDKPPATDSAAADGDSRPQINHENFAINAQNAINFYSKQLGTGTFDKVYMVGDPDKLVRGKYYTEGTNQLNMPHILELFGAAQAKKFFDSSPAKKDYENTEWYADPYQLKGDTLSDLVWSDYSDGGNLRTATERFMLFNYYFSMYIVPKIFNYSGRAGQFFELRGFNAAEETNVPSWIYDGNFGFDEYRGLIFRKRHFIGWQEGIPSTSFEMLFEYLTDSAKWYCNLIHEYQRDAVTCWTCTAQTCNENFSGQLNQCMSPRTLLSGLFGDNSRGSVMIAKRACFTYWLDKVNKPKDSEFQDKADEFIKDVPGHALLNAVENPLDSDMFSGLSLTKENKAEVFMQLVHQVYDIVSSLKSQSQ